MKLSLRIALWLEHFRRCNLAKLHPLQQLFWECTLRCNVHCLHCGSDCIAQSDQADMPLADFLHVLDTEVTPHVNPCEVMIVVSGGEPTMRKDLQEIGYSLMKRGYPWGMVTNGLALTAERFKALREVGLCSLTISLDGLEPQHNWLRQHPQSFDHACNAIRMAAAEKQLSWDVVTCVNQRNINNLSSIRDMLWGMGVRHWRLFGIDPMGRAASQPELLLSNVQFRQLLDFIVQERKEGRHVSYSCEGFLGEYEGKVRDYLYQCAAGISVASILVDGHISACTSIRGKYYQGNIYNDAFWDVWQNGFQAFRNRSWMKQQAPCKNCKMFNFCEGNGMHLRREDGTLMTCHLSRLA